MKHAIAIGLLFSAIAGAAVAAPASPKPSAGAAALPLILRGRTPLPGYTGDFDHLDADLKGNRLFLAAEDHGTLEEFNLRTGTHLRTIRGFETPHSIFAVPGRHELLVTDGSDTVKRLDDRTLARIGTIRLHPGADSIGFDASTGHLFVVTGGKDVKLEESWLEEVVPQTGKVIGTVHFDADHVEALAVEQHGPHIFINITDKNEVDVIDKRSLKIVARWPIHEARQNALAALDEKTHRLFIVARDPGKMIVLNSDTGAALASFEAPGHVDGEAFDAANRRIYAPGGDGWIGVYQEIDADHFAELAHVPSAQGAKTTILVPQLHRLYVGVSPGRRHSGGEVLWFDVAHAADAASAAVRRVDTIRVPGEPLASFDIGFVNSEGVYALSDRSNTSVDLFDAAAGTFIGRAAGFKGYDQAAGFGAAGPDGIVAVGATEFWAGDGDSTVKIVDVQSKSVVEAISTGGRKRVDEMAYDARDHLVIVVNNADKPPFVTFIASRSRRVLGKIVLERASDGAEQPAWDPATGLVYLSIPVIDHVEAKGAIAVLDPRTRKLEKLMPVDQCMPAGLAVGPRGRLLIGCSDDAVAAGFPAKSLVMDARSGRILATIDEVGGSDEVWYDAKSRRYYLAAAANPGGPVLGVVDALTNRWIGNFRSGERAHSVAADPRTGRVFVPIQAHQGGGDCASGCIAVYAGRE